MAGQTDNCIFTTQTAQKQPYLNLFCIIFCIIVSHVIFVLCKKGNPDAAKAVLKENNWEVSKEKQFYKPNVEKSFLWEEVLKIDLFGFSSWTNWRRFGSGWRNAILWKKKGLKNLCLPVVWIELSSP